MSYRSVNIHVENAAPPGDPIEGMLVRVFDEQNKVFYGQDITDDDGIAGFTLFTGVYVLRFYKFGAQVKQPLKIEVLEQELNAFTVQATVFEPPLANDPRLCRASGFFRDITGAPHAKVDLFFTGVFNPVLLEGSAVMSERKAIRTDSEGFGCVDLIRCARYMVIIQGLEEAPRYIDVPDLPSVNLPDLLFPVVEKVLLGPRGPYTLSVGQTLSITPSVVASNGVPLEGVGSADVQWSVSDSSVVSLVLTATTLELTGRAAGTAELQAVRRDQSIIRIPSTGVQGLPQTITIQ